MELVYLWVKDYKNIENQGFNFSSKFTCSYEKDELTIKKNDDSMNDFFGKNINITAIVGKNGSGKSNILNLIFNEHIMKNIFFIMKDGDNLKLYGIKPENKKYLNNTIYHNQIEDRLFKCQKLSSGKLENVNLAFYTPLFQNIFTDNKQNYPNKFNLSPSGLIDKYQEEQKIYEKITFKDLYGIYNSNSIQNIIDMLKNSHSLVLPFEIPTELKIMVNPVLREEDFLKEYEFLKDISKSEDTFYGYTEQRIIKNWICDSFHSFYKNDEKSAKMLLKKIKENFKEIYSIDKLIEIFPKDDANSFIVELDNIKQFLDNIKALCFKNKDKEIILKIKDISSDFISDYNKAIQRSSSFFDFSWSPELSAGEETFLSQFALFYKNFKNKDKILLLIDEGETTMHPNWQKNYIKWLVDFFEKNFTNKKFHIMLTSHSPFILSDLPKQNVIFLDKDKNGNCKVADGLKDKKQTFGANIHTLLTDGFFMDGGLMGEFAKSKINEIIDFLNDKKKLEEISIKEKQIKQIIDTIGEPFLKQKLLDMYYIKYVEESLVKARKNELLVEKKRIEQELKKYD